MQRLVQERFPDTELNVEEADKKGYIPPGLLEVILEKQDEEVQKFENKGSTKTAGMGPSLHHVKNATPGGAATEVTECLEDIRPKAFTMDRESQLGLENPE